jgi:hypothetical protein
MFCSVLSTPRSILEFLTRWPDVDRIVIHCVAGQGRSPAVAMGICELQGRPTEELEMRYPLWNTWVRSELVRVGLGRERSLRHGRSQLT